MVIESEQQSFVRRILSFVVLFRLSFVGNKETGNRDRAVIQLKLGSEERDFGWFLMFLNRREHCTNIYIG